MENSKNNEAMARLKNILDATEAHREVFESMVKRIISARAETEVSLETARKIVESLETFALDAISAQPTVSAKALGIALQQATDVYLEENIGEIMEENKILRQSRLEEFIRTIAPHLKPNWEK
ncbi:hypothetical protein JXR01_00895 [Candidatus Kaiserbacteria bacterium]|nr:MAG: hypothetical protein JXR01_00895 [Candidatus Kaiserbacteria bacterium]